MHEQARNPVLTFWRCLWGTNKKLPSTERRKGTTMDVGGSNAQGGDLGLSEFVTLREIANEARKKAMHKWMERVKSRWRLQQPSCMS